MQNHQIPYGDTTLAAFFHPAPSGPERPILIICHGFCGSAEGGSSLELADRLQECDLAVMRFRFTPHQCLSQQVTEISHVVAYCQKHLGTEIALLGRSMGAAAALVFAAASRRLSGLCLMASPADLPTTFRGILGEDYTRLVQGHAITGFHEGDVVHLTPEFIRDFDNYDLPAAAARLNGIPLLLVHGQDDSTVPVEHARILYSFAKEPKRLLLLPNHSHSFSCNPERFIPTIVEWISQTVFPSTRL